MQFLLKIKSEMNTNKEQVSKPTINHYLLKNEYIKTNKNKMLFVK